MLASTRRLERQQTVATGNQWLAADVEPLGHRPMVGGGAAVGQTGRNTNTLPATLVSIGDVTHNAVWTGAWVQQAGAPANVRLRVRATDGPTGGDLIEAGIDNVRICTGVLGQIFVDSFETGDTTAWSSTVP